MKRKVTKEERAANVAKLREMMNNVKREGFWYSEHEPNYPVPEANVLSQEEAGIIFTLIQQKEAMEAMESLCCGFSASRITGERLGCNEYMSRDFKWRWPGDFATHYVRDHRVKPSDEFLKYIGYE